MHFEVERLTSEPRPFAYEEGSAWWCTHMPRQAGLPRELPRPLRVEGVGYRGAGEEVVLEGRIEGGLELECSRCVGPYLLEIDESFRVVLEPAGTRAPAEPEAAAALARDGLCLSDDLDLGWYRGSEIQLDSMCLERIALALPVKPLCREECAGLCPRCGIDRNGNSCQCEEVSPKSPFSALAALRGGPTEGAK